MVERSGPTTVAGFFTSERPQLASVVTLGEDAAHHMRVRRLEQGATVRLTDGMGHLAHGVLVKLARTQAQVEVAEVQEIEPPAEVHLLVPVSDRDRMLWLAEKSVEFGVASWRPVMWRRSRSVSPRGEGQTFHHKVHARMVAALLQSGGAWLPALFPECNIDRAIAAAPEGERFILHQRGADPFPAVLSARVAVAVGPEGGMEDAELEAFVAGGFTPTRVGGSTLRFETAGIAALALATTGLVRTERTVDA